MGYPMTYRRVVNRNRLVGDYGARMSGINTKPWDHELLAKLNENVDRVEVLLSHCETLDREIDSLNGRWSAIVGDLRRLEADTLDEHACARIADRVGCDADTVAAVLGEWIA